MTISKEWCDELAKLPLAQEIIELLTPISKDPDFVYGSIVFCKTKEQRQKLIDEVKSKNLTKYGEVCHVVNEIAMGRM